MPTIDTVCAEPGCHRPTRIWVGGIMQHESAHNLDRACPKHRAKYQKIYDEHVKACKRLGVPV
jgi:hypothetical protein